MRVTTREARLSAAFVKLTDTLVDDYDVVDVLHWLVEECATMLDTQAGGVLLVNPGGSLQLVASTSEEAKLVEMLQLAAGAGPCLDCFRSGEAVTVSDLHAEPNRWPQFSQEALKFGFKSVHATPLRLRGQVIGTMNLFSIHLGALVAEDVAVARALANVATIGILQKRNLQSSRILTEQLQRALDSRILIEQAKGVIAAKTGMNMGEAFAALRAYATHQNVLLRQVADDVITGRVEITRDPAETHPDSARDTRE